MLLWQLMSYGYNVGIYQLSELLQILLKSRSAFSSLSFAEERTRIWRGVRCIYEVHGQAQHFLNRKFLGAKSQSCYLALCCAKSLFNSSTVLQTKTRAVSHEIQGSDQ